MNAVIQASTGARRVVHRTRGSKHGPITRLMSPSDLGEVLKPFVFLDYFEIPTGNGPMFGWHPHSGIATVTVIHEGATSYEETTGQKGILFPGGVEWMRAGRGVWHTGATVGETVTKGFQLWVALPADLELAPCDSRYLASEDVASSRPARVILGDHAGAGSAIPAPQGINYLDVELKAGERWSYQPPPGHEVLWLALAHGSIQANESISGGELVVFEESNASIEIKAPTASRFALGSAVKHPHALVTGYYSVHTSAAALHAGESEIRRIGSQWAAAGVIR